MITGGGADFVPRRSEFSGDFHFYGRHQEEWVNIQPIGEDGVRYL
jgi:hypothetical protein